MKTLSLKAALRLFGEPYWMACHMATGESYYHTITNRIFDPSGRERADMAWLFA